MSWRYDLYGIYVDDEHEWETGFESESDAEDAVSERMTNIIDEKELDPEDEDTFDWELTEEEG